jgi:hypothetical protein
MHVRRAGQRSARPLNCGVMRHMPKESQLQDLQPSPPRRPFLLGLFSGALTLQAVFLPLIVVFTLVSASDSVVVYNGVQTTMGEVRLKMVGVLVLWFVFAAYFGPALWRGSATARRALLATCLVAAVAGLVTTFLAYQGKSGLVVAAIYVGVSNLIGCAIFWWYLYMKPNVREFFERRSARVAGAA